MRTVTSCLSFTRVCLAALLLFSSSGIAAPVPLRVDLYDAADNHLLYLMFIYTHEGRNVGREIYTPDGSFLRNVVIQYDEAGNRTAETSYDFKGNVIYSTSLLHDEISTGFTILDRFNMDFTGEKLTYTTDDPLHFNLRYSQSGKTAAEVNYTQDAATGLLQRVDIGGPQGSENYYGIFACGEPAGVTTFRRSAGKTLPASVLVRGTGIDVHFNLRSAANVRCELITLSGRLARVLYNGWVPKGAGARRFNFMGRGNSIADGLYLFRVSVDGAATAHTRYLHQSTRGGIR